MKDKIEYIESEKEEKKQNKKSNNRKKIPNGIKAYITSCEYRGSSFQSPNLKLSVLSHIPFQPIPPGTQPISYSAYPQVTSLIIPSK